MNALPVRRKSNIVFFTYSFNHVKIQKMISSKMAASFSNTSIKNDSGKIKHCQHCSISFGHSQQIVDHLHKTHPFQCYYCKETYIEFDKIIQHSFAIHSKDILKIKHLELNEANGQFWGYLHKILIRVLSRFV